MKFKVGDKVKVKKEIENPHFGWGCINYKSTGIIKEITGEKIIVDFGKLDSTWHAIENELELVKPKQFTKNMKVIDLLVKISKGEEVPNKFKFASQTFTKKGNYIEDEDGDNLLDSVFTDFSNLNDEIEIIEESQILDETEKKYLSDVIRPFKNEIKSISKQDVNSGKHYIYISLKDSDWVSLPLFKDKRMYKGMELEKKYTLKELGLK